MAGEERRRAPDAGLPRVVGVAGAGTMGAGIAQLAAQAGARTLVHDPDAAALRRGIERARERLDADAAARLEPAGALAELAPCGLVIEAAPEDVELKRRLLADVAGVVAPDCVLATNTSSLTVTAVGAGVPGPERVVGMHFFNPAPVMRLVEVVAGEATGEAALALARATGEAMGRRVIAAADGVGFLVNRCNRPFSLEALRVVQEGLATPEQVDRICRLGGGFRMGPFELMDLVGIDVGVAVAESFWRQSYGEPRWRPSPLAARLAAAGRHGRKTGHGWYGYPGGRPPDADPPAPRGGEGAVAIAGSGRLAQALRRAAADAGWRVTEEPAAGERPAVVVACDGAVPAAAGVPLLVDCASAPLAALAGGAAGFHLVPPLGRLAELTVGPATADAAAAAAERFFTTLGMAVERVGDAPGLVLGRIVAQLVNEAAFALGERVGSADDIDAGMTLGLNHPRGPLEWADAIGADAVLALVDGLHREYREERYRPAPALVRAVRTGRPLRACAPAPADDRSDRRSRVFAKR